MKFQIRIDFQYIPIIGMLLLWSLSACSNTLSFPIIQNQGSEPSTPTSVKHGTVTQSNVETPSPFLVTQSKLLAQLNLRKLDPSWNPEIITNWSGGRFNWAKDSNAITFVNEDAVWQPKTPEFAPQKLTEAKNAHHPRWSPDDLNIAFAYTRQIDNENAYGTVGVVNVQDSRQIDLLSPVFLKNSGLLSSSGKGQVEWLNNQTLSFTEHCGTGCEALYTLDTATKSVTQIIGDDRAIIPASEQTGVNYFWSPEQKRVAALQAGRGIPEIALLDLSKKQVTKLSPEKDWFFQNFQGWSPDGQYFLYTQWSGSPESYIKLFKQAMSDLYLWDTHTNNRTRILPRVYQASWSPDGSKIAFVLIGDPIYDQEKRIQGTRFKPGEPFSQFVGIFDLTLMKVLYLQQVGARPKYQDWTLNDWLALSHPVWSADARQVAFWKDNGDLWVMSADGTEQQQVTRAMQVVEVSYSDDSKKLAIGTLDKLFILEKP